MRGIAGATGHVGTVTRGSFGGWVAHCSCRWTLLGSQTQEAAQDALLRHITAPPPAGGATEGSREP